MSRISIDADVSRPRFSQAWRADAGTIHATVYLSASATAIFFDSAADARALAAACIEAADGLDQLAAETGPADPTPEQDGGQ